MSFFSDLYTPSNSQNGFWNLLKTLVQTSVFWVVFLWLLPKLIVTAEKSIFKTDFEAYTLMGWALFFIQPIGTLEWIYYELAWERYTFAFGLSTKTGHSWSL